MEPQLHKILLTLVVVGMIITGLIVFMSDAVNVYEPTGYNESDLDSLNKLSTIQSDMNVFEADSTGIGEDEKEDILGGFFKSAYQSAQVLKGSVSVASSMTEEAIDANSQHLGGMGDILKSGLQLMILIIILIGIFLAFITKSNRT